jgi:hypothetical protein
MSNLASDHYDYTTDPRCTCRQVHGNADDDGICARCRPRVEASMDAREKAIHEALGRFMAAVEAVRWSDDKARILEGFLKTVTVTFKRPDGAVDSCLLCGWTDGCKPGCATEAIAGLL